MIMNRIVPKTAPEQQKSWVGRSLIPLILLALIFTLVSGVERAHAMNSPEVSTLRIGPVVNASLNRRYIYLDLADTNDWYIAYVQKKYTSGGVSRWSTVCRAILEEYAIGKCSTRTSFPSGTKLRIVINDEPVMYYTRA